MRQNLRQSMFWLLSLLVTLSILAACAPAAPAADLLRLLLKPRQPPKPLRQNSQPQPNSPLLVACSRWQWSCPAPSTTLPGANRSMSA